MISFPIATSIFDRHEFYKFVVCPIELNARTTLVTCLGSVEINYKRISQYPLCHEFVSGPICQFEYGPQALSLPTLKRHAFAICPLTHLFSTLPT